MSHAALSIRPVDRLGLLPLALDTPLVYLKGVGPARAAMLTGKGLETVEDLLHYFPFRYEDRSNLKPISQLAPGEMATVIAEVRSAKLSGFRRRNLGLFEAKFTDASRAILLGKWFHGAYLADRLTPGTRVALFGKVEFDSYRGELQMMHPGNGIPHRRRRRRRRRPARRPHRARLRSRRKGQHADPANVSCTASCRRCRIWKTSCPRPSGRRLRFPSRTDGVREAHFPPSGTPIRILNDFRSPAQFRLIFEEFFWLECGLEIKRQRARTLPGIEFALTDQVREQIKKLLPFKPTERRSASSKKLPTTCRAPVR